MIKIIPSIYYVTSLSSSMLGVHMLDPILFSEHSCDNYGHSHFRCEETEAQESLNNLPAAWGSQDRNLGVPIQHTSLPLRFPNSLAPKSTLGAQCWGREFLTLVASAVGGELPAKKLGKREGMAVRRMASSSCPPTPCHMGQG